LSRRFYYARNAYINYTEKLTLLGINA